MWRTAKVAACSSGIFCTDGVNCNKSGILVSSLNGHPDCRKGRAEALHAALSTLPRARPILAKVLETHQSSMLHGKTSRLDLEQLGAEGAVISTSCDPSGRVFLRDFHASPLCHICLG